MSYDNRLGRAAQITQQSITLGFRGDKPLHHSVQVGAGEHRFRRATSQVLNVNEKLLGPQLQKGDFIFEFAHGTEPPR